jgi:hypothetical protein
LIFADKIFDCATGSLRVTCGTVSYLKVFEAETAAQNQIHARLARFETRLVRPTRRT